MNELSKKELTALEHVAKQKNLEPYFFEKLISQRDIKWIEILKSRGFLDKTNIPVLSEGNYIEEWNVLNYLNSIVEKLVINDDDKNILYILDILLQAAEVSKNYKVFSQSVTIIKNIPLSKISNVYIKDFLDYWLECEFAIDFILREIEIELIPYLLSDSVKSLITFEEFLRTSINTSSQSNYILKYLLENKPYLFKILDINPSKICMLFIELLEKECFIPLASRNIDDYLVSIENINNQTFKITKSELILEKNFGTRENDIKFIIDNLKSILKDTNLKNLDRICKLLYGNLFDKDTYESIFENQDYLFTSTDYLIGFIKVGLTEYTLPKDILVSLITQMVKSRYDLIKKLGIFTIVQKWDDLKDTFLSLFKTEACLFDYIFRHYMFDDETKHLFELLKEDIGETTIILLENIINKGEYIFHEREDESYYLKWKQKRYKALSNIPSFKEKLEDIKQITGIDIELSPAIGPVKAGWIENVSPYSKEEIISMPLNELVVKMTNFREVDRFSLDLKEISYRGFGTEIKNVLIRFPDHFIGNLEKFKNVQYEFISYLLEGFSELVKQNEDLDYCKVLKFLILYTSQDGFWQDELKFEKENEYLMTHEGILKESLNFIINMVSNDKITFNKIHLDLILKFIKSYLNRVDFGNVEEVLFSNKDISFYSLNSLGGRYVRTLLQLALKIKRIDMPGYELYWEQNIKSIMEFLMHNSSIDCYVLLGEYISNFSYIDEKWIEDIINDTTPQHEMWQYFITGYLDSRTVYYKFYALMGKNYLTALEYKSFDEKDIKEKIGIHILVGYINGFEEDTGIQLMSKLLEIWDEEILEVVIRHCFNIEEKQLATGVERSDVEFRILKLWNELINKCSSEDLYPDLKNKELIKDSIGLINNFSIINESIVKNLTFAFKYVSNSFEVHDVVDYCERLINSNQAYPTKLITSLLFELFNQCIPSYPEEKIKNLLDYLRDNNEFESLNQIQHTYVKLTKKSFVVNYISKFS
ncbi:hypothetical protein ACSLFS_25335 [Priestia megaterium]|uniref:hypothetical protein n=1 Tax=Priestia megaterium TaxID=1404 RepID=UPI003EE379C9